MRASFKFLLGLVALLFLQPYVASSAGEILRHKASHSEIRLLMERESIGVGGTTWLAFEITPRVGWHTYWKNPGDSGAAPIFEWTAPEGYEFGKPVYGTPKRIPVAHLMNYGYKGASTVLIPIKASSSVSRESVAIKLVAEWLVCDVECVPQVGEWDLLVNSAVKTAVSPETRNVFVAARAQTPELAYWDSKLVIADVSSELYVFADESELEDLSSAYFFPEGEGIAVYSGEQVWTASQNGLQVRIPRKRGDTSPEIAEGILQLVYNGGEPQYYALEPELKLAKAPVELSTSQVGVMPLWQAALYAFFGGLILNLMPCVFPILSLKAFAFVAANYKSAANRRKEGWAYTLGIWISFMAIVAVLMALRAGGAAIGWGFQLQEPLFVGLLAILMVLVALSLAGLFTIQFGFEGAGQGFASREGIQGAFFKGVLATLVATPCTAPLMAPAIGFALTQPTVTVVIVFSLLALGLALPFLMLSYSAKVASMMPKPGPWMEKVKQGLAFPMLLTAAWLVYVYDLQAGATATLVLLLSAVFIAFAAWLWGQSASLLIKIVAISVLVTSIYGLVRFSVTATAPTESITLDQQAYSETRLNMLLDKGKPVFVYFTAEWCITCKVNEKVALFREETQAAFKEKGVVMLKGDWTNRNNEIAAVLAKYGRAGVPLYLYFPANEREAIVLPELITPSTIIDAL